MALTSNGQIDFSSAKISTKEISVKLIELMLDLGRIGDILSFETKISNSVHLLTMLDALMKETCILIPKISLLQLLISGIRLNPDHA